MLAPATSKMTNRGGGKGYTLTTRTFSSALEEVSSCNCTESTPSAASINTGTDMCEMDTSDQDSNFFHVGCISPYAALPKC